MAQRTFRCVSCIVWGSVYMPVLYRILMYMSVNLVPRELWAVTSAPSKVSSAERGATRVESRDRIESRGRLSMQPESRISQELTGRSYYLFARLAV